MSGDYSRFTHDPAKRYGGVRQQQGRVALDSDWNEQRDILERRFRLMAQDALGAEAIAWRTTPEAFRIGLIAGAPPDLSIGEGRAYVDGWLAEHLPGEGATYSDQPFLPAPPPLPATGGVLVFLRLFEREITSVEDPGLIDPALGGADTTTRAQMAWQVIAVAAPDGEAVCDIDPYALFPPSPARLSTDANLAPEPDDPCVLPPEDGYRGTVNSLYRVEVHTPGPMGTATFKWSRDNASVVSAVTDIAVAGGQTVVTVDRIGRDAVLRFHPLQWVELTDDHRELMGEPGEMARILDIDEDDQTVTLAVAVPTAGGRAFGATADEIEARHTRLIAWSQTDALNPTLTADGTIPIVAGAIPLELGIEATFTLEGGAGDFQVGDHWVFAARTADASVERLTAAPPRGVQSRWMQLAAIADITDADAEPFDCRPRAPGCDCCCEITIGRGSGAAGDYDDLASAVAALPGVAPDESVHVVICFGPGDFAIPAMVSIDRPNLTIRGCGPSTRLLPQQGPAMTLAGARQTLEDLTILAEGAFDLLRMTGTEQVVQRVELENQGRGRLLVARGLSDFRMRDCAALGEGGVGIAGDELDVRDCRFLGGPLRIGPETDRARVVDCDLIGSASHGIILGGKGFAYDVEIARCRIRGAAGNGVASAVIDPEGEDAGLIVGLTLRGNEIVENLTGELEARDPTVPFGGVVLGTVYDLIVEDNRIEDNGVEATAAVCGVFARSTRGAAFDRNVIRRNGPRAGGALLPGPQAGISLREANVGMRRLVDPDNDARRVAEVDVLPGAVISGNRIEARRGQALWIRGMGRMSVTDNQLHAADILADLFDKTVDTLDQYVGTVFLLNAGLPAYFGAFFAGLGFDALASGALTGARGAPLLGALTVGGQTIFRGNQARLDLARQSSELALANLFVASLDDTLVSGNQTEGVLFLGAGDTPTTNISFSLDILFADLFNVAITTRQTDNGLMSTPWLTAFSILSLGLFNHCTDNQATSCIRPIGLSPKSVNRDNVEIFPHPVFCPEDPRVDG
jgi:hypothetical protein